MGSTYVENSIHTCELNIPEEGCWFDMTDGLLNFPNLIG
jgi:hypothetical protein